jgi:hypothetical protein
LAPYARYNETFGYVPAIMNVTTESAIERLSFREQIALWASADLIIGPHGAGLTAIIFARSHVPLIEVFPHKYYPSLYHDISTASGHPHFGIMGEPLPASAFKGNDQNACELWHGIDILVSLSCLVFFCFNFFF